MLCRSCKRPIDRLAGDRLSLFVINLRRRTRIEKFMIDGKRLLARGKRRNCNLVIRRINRIKVCESNRKCRKAGETVTQTHDVPLVNTDGLLARTPISL